MCWEDSSLIDYLWFCQLFLALRVFIKPLTVKFCKMIFCMEHLPLTAPIRIVSDAWKMCHA